MLKIKKVKENAKVPHRATSGSAGLDLCACIDEPVTLEGGDTAVIPTGIAIALPSADYGTESVFLTPLVLSTAITAVKLW